MPQIIIFTDQNAAQDMSKKAQGGATISNRRGQSYNFRDIDSESDVVPIKTAGAYVIASHLRSYGYSTLVIDNLQYLILDDFKKFQKKIASLVTDETFLVGISSTFLVTAPIIKHLKLLLYSIKRKNPLVKFVVGGNSPDIDTIQTDLNIDYKISGLGETSILKLCKSIEQGLDTPSNLIDITGDDYNFHEALPAFDKSDLVIPGEVLPIEISRGCRFSCKFCDLFLIGRSSKDTKYIRSQYSLSKEFEHNYKNFGTTNYVFVCDTFNESTEKLLQVHRAIQDVGIKINFACYSRLELIHRYREQVDILKEMGISGIFFGIESLNTPSAKAIGKGLTLEQKIDILDHLHEKWKDVIVHGNFIIGLPFETEETVAHWVNLILDGTVKLDSANLNPLLLVVNYTNRIWNSAFNKEPEKYGYEFPHRNAGSNFWVSPTMDYDQALMIQNHWQPILDRQLQSPFVTFVSMALRNLGFDHDYIRKFSRDRYRNDKNIQTDIDLRIKKYYSQYAEMFYNL